MIFCFCCFCWLLLCFALFYFGCVCPLWFSLFSVSDCVRPCHSHLFCSTSDFSSPLQISERQPPGILVTGSFALSLSLCFLAQACWWGDFLLCALNCSYIFFSDINFFFFSQSGWSNSYSLLWPTVPVQSKQTWERQCVGLDRPRLRRPMCCAGYTHTLTHEH